jgi:Uma2 family endonuclease
LEIEDFMQAKNAYVSGVAELFPPQGEWTEADYFALPETARIVELWDGELSIEPLADAAHQRIVDTLAACLSAYDPVGEVIVAPVAVRLGEGRIRQPDVLYLKPEGWGRITQRYVNGPPDWVAEVISPGSRETDTKDKLTQYAEAGIPEYWLIDPEAGTVSVYVLGEGATAYTLRASYAAGETIRSAALDGFEVAVDDLLRG